MTFSRALQRGGNSGGARHEAAASAERVFVGQGFDAAEAPADRLFVGQGLDAAAAPADRRLFARGNNSELWTDRGGPRRRGYIERKEGVGQSRPAIE